MGQIWAKGKYLILSCSLERYRAVLRIQSRKNPQHVVDQDPKLIEVKIRTKQFRISNTGIGYGIYNGQTTEQCQIHISNTGILPPWSGINPRLVVRIRIRLPNTAYRYLLIEPEATSTVYGTPSLNKNSKVETQICLLFLTCYSGPLSPFWSWPVCSHSSGRVRRPALI